MLLLSLKPPSVEPLPLLLPPIEARRASSAALSRACRPPPPGPWVTEEPKQMLKNEEERPWRGAYGTLTGGKNRETPGCEGV